MNNQEDRGQETLTPGRHRRSAFSLQGPTEALDEERDGLRKRLSDWMADRLHYTRLKVWI